MIKLIRGAKLNMVNKQKEFKKTNKNIKGLTTIDMQKVKENKEELKAKIEETEKDIQELANSDNELDKKLAKLFSADLELFKTLGGVDKELVKKIKKC